MIRSRTHSGALGACFGAVLMLALTTASCGDLAPTGGGGDDQIANETADDVATQSSPLSVRWRWRRWRTAVAPDASGVDAGSPGSTGGSSGGAVSVGPTGPETTFVNGGRCPNNAPMPAGGACGPYGINCTYDDATGTHYCTCLNSGGWSCR
jgi:hypothetical protein